MPSCPCDAQVTHEFLELSTRTFSGAPGADGFEIDGMSRGDGNRRRQALAIFPVIERREAIPAGVCRGKQDDTHARDGQFRRLH